LFSVEDCGLQFEAQEGLSLGELVDWSKYAEREGYGYVFRSDHFLPIPMRGGVDSPECWTSLGVIASNTETVKFGTMVTPIGYRNPALLAKMASTLSSYSGGRLMLGIGAGWYKDEYAAYGYDFPDFPTRMEQFSESLGIIRPLINGEKVDFKGKHFSVKAEGSPKTKTPLIIGGRHPKIVELTGRFADEWNIYASPLEVYLKLKKVLDSASSDRRVVVSQTGTVIIGENRSGVIAGTREMMRFEGRNGDPEAEIEKQKKEGAPCGTPEEISSYLNERIEAGIQRFYFQLASMQTNEMADLLTQTVKSI
jgi:alkanesulfonate monooxygenase SsuD/methylene tetrahydromethanopterin reductase-like flavin-dependent oxidoreductase (luciferase family)